MYHGCERQSTFPQKIIGSLVLKKLKPGNIKYTNGTYIIFAVLSIKLYSIV